jgi:hypothetical protein
MTEPRDGGMDLVRPSLRDFIYLDCRHRAELFAEEVAKLPSVHSLLDVGGKGKPFVIALQGLDVFNTCFLSGRPAVWRRKISVDVYRASRTLICISGKVRRNSEKRNADACSTVVYNGVNPRCFHGILPRRESLIRGF